jgi:DNA-binding CsgD family transcriptional regulator
VKKEPAFEGGTAIPVEVRLSDDALASRIIDWLEQSGSPVISLGDGQDNVITIADHVPDDCDGPIILIGQRVFTGWEASSKIAARLPSSVDLVKLRIAIEAAAHGLRIEPSRQPDLKHPPDRAPFDARDAVESLEQPSVLLTPREREVLCLLAEGISNKAIARHLGISAHTAKFHVASLLFKLKAANRTEAVSQAIRLGLLIF